MQLRQANFLKLEEDISFRIVGAILKQNEEAILKLDVGPRPSIAIQLLSNMGTVWKDNNTI